MNKKYHPKEKGLRETKCEVICSKPAHGRCAQFTLDAGGRRSKLIAARNRESRLAQTHAYLSMPPWSAARTSNAGTVKK
jgi:hypothetical protein